MAKVTKIVFAPDVKMLLGWAFQHSGLWAKFLLDPVSSEVFDISAFQLLMKPQA